MENPPAKSRRNIALGAACVLTSMAVLQWVFAFQVEHPSALSWSVPVLESVAAAFSWVAYAMWKR